MGESMAALSSRRGARLRAGARTGSRPPPIAGGRESIGSDAAAARLLDPRARPDVGSAQEVLETGLEENRLHLAQRMSRLGTESAFDVLARAKALEATGRDII